MSSSDPVASGQASPEPFLHGEATGTASRRPQLVGSSSACSHTRVLLRKNALLKQREWSTTCLPFCPGGAICELFLPLAVVALLWWARDKCGEGGQCKLPVLAGWGGVMPHGNLTTDCSEGLKRYDEHNHFLGYSSCKAWTNDFVRPIPFIDVLAYLHWSGKRLAFATDNPGDEAKVQKMVDWMSDNWFPEVEMADIPCMALETNIFKKFDKDDKLGENYTLPCNESDNEKNPGVLPSLKDLTLPKIYSKHDLSTYLDSASYGDEGIIFAAITFQSLGGDGSLGAPGKWAYSIGMNVTSGTGFWTGAPFTRPLDLGVRTHESNIYLWKGFSSIQLTLDRYIIGRQDPVSDMNQLLEANSISVDDETQETLKVLAEPVSYGPQSVETIPMPSSGVIVDGFYELVSVVFPLAFILAFLYTQKKVLNELITEKETKLRESLRMMGVSSAAIISSWYISYAIIFAFLCAIFAAVSSSHIFPNSSGVLVFLFFWLWCMAFLSFAFFIHTFFNNSRTGGIVGMAVMFAQWVVYSSQKQDGAAPAAGVMAMLMFMPNGAFSAGLDVMSKFEAAKVGVRWSNLNWVVINTTFFQVLVMLVVNIFIWTILGWYFDRVLPKEFGVRLPWYFPFMRSYWRDQPVVAPGSDQATSLEAGAEEDVPAVCVGHDAAEAVAPALRERSRASGTLVSIKKLRREFDTPGGTKVAVANLELSMYEGQILALLGHNGAGKTTTVNMLTGMVAPTSGDAFIAGKSLLTDLMEIRRLIGVCPQHDVLWMELTVLEHLVLFARLRGVPSGEEKAHAYEMMAQVGLTEKANTRAGGLSGGQKRKLSLCLALLGRPSVIFLDEPTSGMDPFSRRSTWNIIRSVRENRVTVLTTHFMDEAEILGDRIAIMAEGELQCCGSSLFLKSRFGAGYRITCARRRGSPSSGSHAASGSSSQLTEVIRKHIPDAELLTDIGAEHSMRLPLQHVSRFPDLFAELDKRKEELEIEHYGLSVVTLEEVFLRVASKEMDGLATSDGDSQVSGQTPRRTPTAGAAAAAAIGESTAASSEVTALVRHLGSLYMKRARYGRRDCKSVACTVLLPVAMLGLGLYLLNRAGNRNMPAVLLDLHDQFGDQMKVPVFVNSTDWMSTALSQQSRSEATTPREDFGDEMLFGRQYHGGKPVVKMCEEHTTPFSKCFRDEKVCHGKFPDAQGAMEDEGSLWTLVTMMRQLGVNLGCKTDKDACYEAFDNACAGGAPECVDRCIQKSGLAEHTCEDQCNRMCKDVKQFSHVCDYLDVMGSHTIGWYCPVDCASDDDPDTCPPTTVCKAPYDLHEAAPLESLNYLMETFQEGQGASREQAHYGAWMTTTWDKDKAMTATLLFNTSALHAVPAYMNMLSSTLKQAASGPGSEIVTLNAPMPRARTESFDKIVNGLVDLVSTFVIIIAFSWVPATIVAYIVREREEHHDSKHQQLISGVKLLSYWTANYLWDLTLYLLPLGLSMLCMVICNIEVFLQNGAAFATAVTFMGYGVAVVPFSYVISFAFKHHTSAQVLVLVFNFVTGLLLMVTSYILSVIESTKDVNESLMWIYRIFPGFGLGNGLFQICKNSFAASLGSAFGGGGDDDLAVNLLGMDVAGKDVLYLYISGPVYFSIVLLIDFLQHSPWARFANVFEQEVSEEGLSPDDPDVEEEVRRVTEDSDKEDDVRILALRKVYRVPEGRPKVAVHGLTFGLRRGECFGFLGMNGAGKSTTLKMLTGATLPSKGTATVAGHDIVTEQWQVRRYLGYCPQHDALLDRLTVREHLELFGRIKQIPRAALKGYCDAMMQDLSLTPHVDKMAMTLSGGNKRKLSLAISLMGAPRLALLDEPSTGVDPAARRLMWNVISAVSTTMQQCSVMLTTHNMEEAEALCSRIGIMVGGRLRCIGSNQHLKARYGRGYQLELRMEPPSEEVVGTMIRDWRLSEMLEAHTMPGICTKMGRSDYWARLVGAMGEGSEDQAEVSSGGAGTGGGEEGRSIREAIERDGLVPARLFIQWWLLEERNDKLREFLLQHFSGAVLLERHGRKLRWHLPSVESLSSAFKLFEVAKQDLKLEDYGISQTSLEQIFNGFADESGGSAGGAGNLLAAASASASAAAAAAAPAPSSGAAARSGSTVAAAAAAAPAPTTVEAQTAAAAPAPAGVSREAGTVELKSSCIRRSQDE